MKRRFLVAGIALVVALAAGGLGVSAHAGGIPVIDAANLTQNITAAIESVSQTLKQIQQYQTQLQQYENQIQNTVAPSAYIWDRATTTMNQLRSAIDTLSYYKNQAGGIDAYLAKFQDLAYYRGSPCFQPGGCSPAQWAALLERRTVASESQKKADDALLRGLDQQQMGMEADAQTLERLQSAAQGSTGQMQAIGYANQLASQQSNQLLQIRGLLIAQQNVIATRMRAEADEEARTMAASEQVRRGTYEASSGRTW
jgi:P-type conjugative transfer protein TrbJ